MQPVYMLIILDKDEADDYAAFNDAVGAANRDAVHRRIPTPAFRSIAKGEWLGGVNDRYRIVRFD